MAEILGDAREAAACSPWSPGSCCSPSSWLSDPRLRHGVVTGVRAYRSGDLVWWQFLGGLGGALIIAGQSIVVPILGVALFTVAVIAGQTANSLVVDRAGLGPAGRQPITRPDGSWLRGSRRSRWQSACGARAGRSRFAPVLLAVVAGAATAIQYAVNGRVASPPERRWSPPGSTSSWASRPCWSLFGIGLDRR